MLQLFFRYRMNYLFAAIFIMILKATSIRRVAMANLVSYIQSSNFDIVSASLSESPSDLSVIFSHLSHKYKQIYQSKKGNSIIINSHKQPDTISQSITIINLIGIVINPNFTQQISHNPMQELSVSVKERINKTKEVVDQSLTPDAMRLLREQEKVRCEKQNFILAMMRANKIMSITLKKSYFRISQQLMTQLEPLFEYKQGCSIEDDFLNEFVHLYTCFFAYFETKFTFKTKIKNFLRPTNHNLIVDLIRYFVDFTRDYYVQTLFWKMRNSNKTQMNQIEDTLTLQPQTNTNTEDQNFLKVKPLGFVCRNYSSVVDPTEPNISPRKYEQSQQKKNYQKHYEILNVNIPTIIFNIPKENLTTINIESLKIKVNQLFRDQKSRNSSIKKIFEDFYTGYREKFFKSESSVPPIPYTETVKRSDKLNAKTQPLKMYLNVQRNGFSVIVLEIDQKKTKNTLFLPNHKTNSISNVFSTASPSKLTTENNLSPLKIIQRVSQGDQIFKGDYFLTSMKVLRVSQNFLPPLVNSNTSIASNDFPSRKELTEKNSKEEQRTEMSKIPFSLKLKRMTDQVEEQIPFINEISSSTNVLVKSTSFKKSTAEKDKKRLQNYNNQLYSGDFISKREASEKKDRQKFEQESEYRLSSKKLNTKKKLINERKSFENGAYLTNKMQSKSTNQVNYESEEKILQWLEKIKNLKEIERRKILGMNF